MVRAYCVFVGRREGLYMTWEECKEEVDHFKGAIYCAFPSIEKADSAYQKYCREREICNKNPSAYKCSNCGTQLKLGISNTREHAGRHFFSCSTCHDITWVDGLRMCPCDRGLCLISYVDVGGVTWRCYYCPFKESCGYFSFIDDPGDVDDASSGSNFHASSGSSSGTACSCKSTVSLTLGEDSQKAMGKRDGPGEGTKIMGLTLNFNVMKLKDM